MNILRKLAHLSVLLRGRCEDLDHTRTYELPLKVSQLGEETLEGKHMKLNLMSKVSLDEATLPRHLTYPHRLALHLFLCVQRTVVRHDISLSL